MRASTSASARCHVAEHYPIPGDRQIAHVTCSPPLRLPLPQAIASTSQSINTTPAEQRQSLSRRPASAAPRQQVPAHPPSCAQQAWTAAGFEGERDGGAALRPQPPKRTPQQAWADALQPGCSLQQGGCSHAPGTAGAARPGSAAPRLQGNPNQGTSNQGGGSAAAAAAAVAAMREEMRRERERKDDPLLQPGGISLEQRVVGGGGGATPYTPVAGGAGGGVHGPGGGGGVSSGAPFASSGIFSSATRPTSGGGSRHWPSFLAQPGITPTKGDAVRDAAALLSAMHQTGGGGGGAPHARPGSAGPRAGGAMGQQRSAGGGVVGGHHPSYPATHQVSRAAAAASVSRPASAHARVHNVGANVRRRSQLR